MKCHARRYTTYEAVLRVLYAMRLNGRGMSGGVPKKCQVCHGWHIGRG